MKISIISVLLLLKQFSTQTTNKSFSNETRSNQNSSMLTYEDLLDIDHVFIENVRNNLKIHGSSDLALLRKSLLYFYDKKVRPLQNSSQPIKIFMGISVSQINKLDEAYQLMTSTLQLSFRWVDEFLTWNSSLYHDSILFRSNEIWKPDIIVSNNVNNFKHDSDDTFMIGNSHNIFDFNERNKYFIRCDSNGSCRWVFPIKILSMCELDLQYFPFDLQECFIDFRSSAYQSDQLTLDKFKSGIILNLINDGEFDIVKAEVESFNQNSSFEVEYETDVSVVRLKILMKRKMVFYLNKIIMPYFVFYIVVLLTYVLPIESGEKKSYSTSILISAMIYLRDSSNLIPKTTVLPMLSIYFNLNLIFIFICIVFTTFIYLIYYCDKTKRKLPNMFKKVVENSRYFLDEKKLELGNKLNHANLNSRKRIKKNQQKQQHIENVIGKEVLNLLKTLKLFIKDQNKNKIDENSKENNLQIDFDRYEINVKTKDKNFKDIHYLNTLENLKFNLVKNKCKILNKKLSKSQIYFDRQQLIFYDSINLIKNCSLNSNCKKKTIFQSCFINDEFIESNSQLHQAKRYLVCLKEYKSQIESYLCKKNQNNNQKLLIDSFYNLASIGSPDHFLKQYPAFIQEWKFLAIIIDRIVFFFFSVFTPITLIIMYLRAILIY